MIWGFKKKALLGVLAVADAALLGTVVALARRVMRQKAHEEVVDTVIRENAERDERIEADGLDEGMDELSRIH